MSHELVLYKYDACPFCYRVQSWLDGRDIPIEMRDTREDPAHQQALRDLTGRTQVPCLVIDGEPMLESGDIVSWLSANYGAEPVGAPEPGRPAADEPQRRRDRFFGRLKRG